MINNIGLPCSKFYAHPVIGALILGANLIWCGSGAKWWRRFGDFPSNMKSCYTRYGGIWGNQSGKYGLILPFHLLILLCIFFGQRSQRGPQWALFSAWSIDEGWTNENPPVFDKTLSPSGWLACSLIHKFTIMQSGATGIANHILPLGHWFSLGWLVHPLFHLRNFFLSWRYFFCHMVLMLS